MWLPGLFMLYFRITWTAVVIFQLVEFIINDNNTTKQVNSNNITANTMCIGVQKDCRFDRKKLHEQNALDRIINWKRLRGAHINSWKTHCQCFNCLTPDAARACPHWRTMSQRIDVNACWSFHISHRFLDSLWER